jgi:hypothetical protein
MIMIMRRHRRQHRRETTVGGSASLPLSRGATRRFPDDFAVAFLRDERLELPVIGIPM